ncbi:MAG TPA: hypothetical protein VL689_14860 [Paraburkholderia sp.]|jgi:hypothetical protein|nr:hypothetical protein [Paraburkholderia sp.]
MLSPYEFATLMLVRSKPDQVDMDRAELDTLLEQQLISLEQLTQGHRRLALTHSGRSLLETVARGDEARALRADALSNGEEVG